MTIDRKNGYQELGCEPDAGVSILNLLMTHHRTWFKVVFNPILRKLGWSIVSIVEDDVVLGYKLKKYPENCPIIKV